MHIPVHKHLQITVVFLCTVHKCNIVKVAEIVVYFISIDYSGNGLFLLDTMEGITLNWKEIPNALCLAHCFG